MRGPYPKRQNSAIINSTAPGKFFGFPSGVCVRLPFCILNVCGDVLDDGEICFVGAAQTLTAARRRIATLAKLSPGQYVIYNGETGERLPLIAKTKPSSLHLKASIRPKTPHNQKVGNVVVRLSRLD
jgi:hypothetical protein